MNYFAHGVRFLDRPCFLAGTAAPDWLSAVDRRARLRAKNVALFADGTGSDTAELAAGVLQHLHDDDRFHRTAAFLWVTSELTRLFRQALPANDFHRPGLLGHLVTELTIDGLLIERRPERLDAYYKALEGLDSAWVQQAVNLMATRRTERLAWFIPAFRQERFLADYANPARMLVRLNQIMRRVKLMPLPGEVVNVISAARVLVARHLHDLLGEMGDL
jgi:hypothetical protein